MRNVLSESYVRFDKEMKVLSLNFFMFSVSGVWPPVGWSSGVAKRLYGAFSFYIVASVYLMMLSQFLDIALVVDNIDDLTGNSLMFVTILAVCCKATVAVVRRGAIVGLVKMLSKEPFVPRDQDEVAIQTKFDGFIRSCSIKYSLLVASSLTAIVVRSVIEVIHGHLPYRAWLPYDSTAPPIMLLTSVQQIVSLIFAALINIGTETLIFGFFLQTCAQLEIFESRLRKLNGSRYREYFLPAASNKEAATVAEYIRHHLGIYRYAKTVNSIFNEVFFVQFFGSILVLCTSVYYLSMHISKSEASTLVYTFGMFVQIFVYCWSGNEVILKSTSVGDAIYRMDWPSLSIGERKALLMIMKRSTIPIKFTSSFLITLSLESYSNILKTSYSAFNVLKQS